MKEIIGTWELKEIYFSFEDGTRVDMYGSEPKGILMYDEHGKMNAQLGKKDRISGDALNNYDSYMAYYGRYHEDSPGKLIHHVIGCVNPDWIGEDEIRFYEVNKDTLKIWTPSLELKGKTTVIQVIWHRVKR